MAGPVNQRRAPPPFDLPPESMTRAASTSVSGRWSNQTKDGGALFGAPVGCQELLRRRRVPVVHCANCASCARGPRVLGTVVGAPQDVLERHISPARSSFPVGAAGTTTRSLDKSSKAVRSWSLANYSSDAEERLSSHLRGHSRNLKQMLCDVSNACKLMELTSDFNGSLKRRSIPLTFSDRQRTENLLSMAK